VFPPNSLLTSVEESTVEAVGFLDNFAQPAWAVRMERKIDAMARNVDDALQGLVDVAVNAVNGLKAAQQEIADLKASDAAEDAAQIQAVLDSVSEKIDAATAALTENPEVPVDPEPVEPEPPVEEEPSEPVEPDTVTDTSE
jgi:hypothetical protein